MKLASSLVWVALALPAFARDVTVRLWWLHPPTEARITRAGGSTRVYRAGAGGARVDGPFTIEVPGSPRLDLAGPLDVKTEKGHLALTLHMPLEEYVEGVLAGESSIFTSAEALKAMAVVARTYAVANLGRHRSEGFDFCDTTHCQDLRLAARSERLRAAVEATEAELVWFQGAPALTFYHRHCGGMTEDAHDVWPAMHEPYLRRQTDTFCLAKGRAEWQSAVRKTDLARALGLEGPAEVEILEHTGSGRVAQLKVGPRRINAGDFALAVGRALGWDLVRSNFYGVFDRGDEVVFQGYGAGHGVGLCQTGANARGEKGQNYRQILAFYYPGTVVGVGAQGLTWARMGGERVEVWSTRPGEDQSVVALADRLLSEAERRAGLTSGASPRVRIYPTVAVYRDATGEPGWVAASTAGRTIRLQPAELLRSTGRLESTLLHEMLHVVIQSNTQAPLPLWFREGLVLYLMEPGKPPGAQTAPAAGLAQPRSELEMRKAYEAARSRVKTLVDRYGLPKVMEWVRTGALPSGARESRTPARPR